MGTRAKQLLERVLPNSLDAEIAVLGALLLSPVQAGAVIRSALSGVEFYFPAHQIIYATASQMLDDGVPVDLMTVSQRLQDAGHLEGIGGATYLSDLISKVPSTANVEYYVETVQEKYLRRSLIGDMHDLIEKCYDESTEMEKVHGEACAAILGATQGTAKLFSISEAIDEGVDKYEAALTRSDSLLGFPTGFKGLDYYTRGFETGSTFCIAARPSEGKTSLVSAIVMHMAEGGVPVGILSHEQKKGELAMRMAAAKSGLNIRHPKTHSPDDRDRFVKACAGIRRLPIYIDDRPGMTLTQIRAVCRSMVARHGCKVLWLDHIQRTKPEKKQSEYEHITAMSGGIDEIASELKVVFIVCSQLNRDVTKEDRQPRLSDLRASGSIEQDMDFVALLSKVHPDERSETLRGSTAAKPLYKLPTSIRQLSDEEFALLTRLNIAKQREGPAGYWENVFLAFEKEYTRYRDVRIPEEPQFASCKDGLRG